MNSLRTIEWVPDGPGRLVPGRVRLIDQTMLPDELRYLETTEVGDVITAIRTLQVRGAPAIGVAAAMGIVLAIQREPGDTARLAERVDARGEDLAAARPTAVNLRWAVERMRRVARDNGSLSPDAFKERLAHEAVAICDEDAAQCEAIGTHGVRLLRDRMGVLTHCNAGGLATARFGTALAPVYVAHEQGMRLEVYADETRPLLQGARLTAWELQQHGIPVTLICDNAAARVMQEGRVQAVLVGADRIAANGDTANKIGTYGLALAARTHDIPFYVLAPTTTFDLALPDGSHIPIEERGRDEVTRGFGRATAPDGIGVYNPAFDVTPAHYITAIVCEHGIAYPPYDQSLNEMMNRRGHRGSQGNEE